MKSEVKVPLRRPIQAHGEELRELTLREPTGKDLRVMGLPFGFSAGGEVQIDAAATHRAISTLAGIPPSSVDQLSAQDFMGVTGALMGFFGEAPTAGTGPGNT